MVSRPVGLTFSDVLKGVNIAAKGVAGNFADDVLALQIRNHAACRFGGNAQQGPHIFAGE